MEQKMFLRSYCLIGLGDGEKLKEDLSFISESNINYVSGKDIIIITFKTTFKIVEIEDFLRMNERTFIIFEMTPGFFTAVLNNDEFQRALFGGDIDNTKYGAFTIEDDIKEFVELMKEDLENVTYERQQIPQPTLDDLLDKISEKGIDNLSNSEKTILNNYSKQKN